MSAFVLSLTHAHSDQDMASTPPTDHVFQHVAPHGFPTSLPILHPIFNKFTKALCCAYCQPLRGAKPSQVKNGALACARCYKIGSSNLPQQVLDSVEASRSQKRNRAIEAPAVQREAKRQSKLKKNDTPEQAVLREAQLKKNDTPERAVLRQSKLKKNDTRNPVFLYTLYYIHHTLNKMSNALVCFSMH
jgi:hypothetical protein